MTKNYPEIFFAPARNAAVTILAVLFLLTGAVFADDINLDMEGAGSATIPKGNTVTRKILRVPQIGGTLKLRFKWHAVSIIPNTFNSLKVEVLHGSTVLATKSSCYSTHSSKTPKCNLDLSVSQTEADKPGDWTLRVVNNSNEEVMGFDISKAGDILVPNFRSVYTPNCPDTVNLDMEGTSLTLAKGNTQERKLNKIGSANGDLVLKMKWHAVNIIPTFNSLKIELMNGSNVIQTQTCYSVHSNQSPKCEFRLTTGDRPADQWKLRITNNSNFEVTGFNIRKEGDILVSDFNSAYKAKCQ